MKDRVLKKSQFLKGTIPCKISIRHWVDVVMWILLDFSAQLWESLLSLVTRVTAPLAWRPEPSHHIQILFHHLVNRDDNIPPYLGVHEVHGKPLCRCCQFQGYSVSAGNVHSDKDSMEIVSPHYRHHPAKNSLKSHSGREQSSIIWSKLLFQEWTGGVWLTSCPLLRLLAGN